MKDFVEVFNTIKRLLPFLLSLKDKRLFPVKAVVAENNDPEERRRIKVYDPFLNGKQLSLWIEPLRTTRSSDPMVPLRGQTVILNFINGNPDEPLYSLYYNDPNPSKPKLNAINDQWNTIDGNATEEVGGDRERIVEGREEISIGDDRNTIIKGKEEIRVDRDYSVNSGETILLKNDAEASIFMDGRGIETHQLPPNGGLVINIGEYNIIKIIPSEDYSISIKSPVPLNIEAPAISTTTSSFTINGREIIVVGSTDSDGDTNDNRGY